MTSVHSTINIEMMSGTPRSSTVLTAAIALATLCGSAHAVVPPTSMFLPETIERMQKLDRDSRWVAVLLDTDQLATLRSEKAPDATIPERGVDTAVSLTDAPLGSADVTNEAASLLDQRLEINTPDGVRFRVDQGTALSDGGIGGSVASLDNRNARVASIVQGEGEYSLTDMEMMWDAMDSGNFELSIVSGITAIQADVSKKVNAGGVSDVADVHSRAAFVPTIGSALSWSISDDWSISGQALTQSIDLGSSFLDFSAQADWRLSDSIGLSAGYQIIRSSFEVGSVSSDLSQEGLFARLQIKF